MRCHSTLPTLLTPLLVALSPVPGVAAQTALASGAQSQVSADPFVPHVRWAEAAPSNAPWLPRDVVFAEGTELVLGAGSVANPAALVLSSADLTGAQLVDQRAFAGALGTLRVASGAHADELYVLSQHALSGPSDRATRVTRLAIDASGRLVEAWNVDVGPSGNGAARVVVSADGAAVVTAIEAAGIAHVHWLAPSNGAQLGAVQLAGGTLRELALSEDGSRLALLVGAELFVLDASGLTLHQQSLPQVTNALALSGDGRTLAVGDGGALSLWLETGGTYAELTRIAPKLGEVPVRLALSRDGARVAVGSWNQVSGLEARFEVRTAAGLLLHEYAQVPGALGLQNYPEAVALTPDGTRAAYGAWGVGDGQPEVLLVDVDSASVVLAANLSGSPRALALSACGTRVAVAAKHAHANQFSSTGEFVLLDSGERELQVLARATPAGRLELSSKHPTASRALFVLGAPLATPVQFRGAGLLFLDRASPMRIKGAFPDAEGRADVNFSVPSLLQGLGVDFAVQAAWRVNGGLVLGAELDPLIL